MPGLTHTWGLCCEQGPLGPQAPPSEWQRGPERSPWPGGCRGWWGTLPLGRTHTVLDGHSSCICECPASVLPALVSRALRPPLLDRPQPSCPSLLRATAALFHEAEEWGAKTTVSFLLYRGHRKAPG